MLSNTIKSTIEADELKDACELFKATAFATDAIQLKARLNELQQNKIRGVLSTQEANLLRNQIRDGLIQLLEKLEGKDDSPAPTNPKQENTGTTIHIHNHGKVDKQVNNPNIQGDLNM